MNAVIHEPAAATSVLVRMGQRFGIEPNKMMVTLKATAFRGEVSNEQMMALLVVAEQYGLNPWTKEIYAFPDRNNGIVPVVGVDGWSRIINSSPQFDGMSFADGPLNKQNIPEWIECTIHRKDRTHPITAREYFAEVVRDVGPWKSHPRRMLRHKSMIQSARLAFGFVGVYDPDEAERVIEATPRDMGPRPDLSEVAPEVLAKWYGQIVDVLNQDKEETAIAQDLRDCEVELNKFPELYIALLDKLAAEGVITKANWRKYLKIGADQVRA